MDESAKDDLIKLQQEQLDRCIEVMDSQNDTNERLHQMVTFWRHEHHLYQHAHKEPLRFLAWTLLHEIWPFKYLWVQLPKE
jgi:hypothetical protein